MEVREIHVRTVSKIKSKQWNRSGSNRITECSGGSVGEKLVLQKVSQSQIRKIKLNPKDSRVKVPSEEGIHTK